MIHIEVATGYDIDGIMEIGRKFFYEGHWHDLTNWEDDLAMNTFLGLMENPNGSFFIAKDGEKVIGIVGGVVCDMWFSYDKLGQESFWYVLPEYRGALGFQLLDKLENDFKKNGATIININCLCKLKDLSRLFRRRGYSDREKGFMKRVQ